MRTYEVLSHPRYYRAQAGDFLIVIGRWREDGRVTRYDGAASIHVGQSAWVSGWEFSVDYIRRRCRRVQPEAVPANWHRTLDRYIVESEVAS